MVKKLLQKAAKGYVRVEKTLDTVRDVIHQVRQEKDEGLEEKQAKAFEKQAVDITERGLNFLIEQEESKKQRALESKKAQTAQTSKTATKAPEKKTAQNNKTQPKGQKKSNAKDNVFEIKIKFKKLFDHEKFEDDLYMLAFEYGLYYISPVAFHALLVQLDDVKKYLKAHDLNPDLLSESLLKTYASESRKGFYDKYDIRKLKETRDKQIIFREFIEDPKLNSLPEDFDDWPDMPQRLAPENRLMTINMENDSNLSLDEAFNKHRKNTQINLYEEKTLHLITDAVKIKGGKLLEIAFFFNAAKRLESHGSLPMIYQEIGLTTSSAYGHTVLNPRYFPRDLK